MEDQLRQLELLRREKLGADVLAMLSTELGVSGSGEILFQIVTTIACCEVVRAPSNLRCGGTIHALFIIFPIHFGDTNDSIKMGSILISCITLTALSSPVHSLLTVVFFKQ